MIKTLKTVSIASVAALTAVAAQAETKTFNMSGFSGVSASEDVTVEVEVGAGFSVTADGASSKLEDLEIKLHGDTLSVGRKGSFFNRGWKNGMAPVVRITMPSMSKAEVSSGAELSASGIEAGDFSASASSGGEMSLEGSCASLRANASSGAEMDAGDLHCRAVDINISTGAEADVFASDSINATASTGGDVDVSGSPQQKSIRKTLGGEVSVK